MDEHATWFDYLVYHLGIGTVSGWEHALDERFHVHVPLNIVLVGLFVILVIVVGAFVVRRRIDDPEKAIVPDPELSVQTTFELVIDATYGMMKGIMTPAAARTFLPLIGTAALFILVSNLLGLVPGFLPPTSNLNVTAATAIVIFVTTHVFGVKEHGIGYFKHFFGPIRTGPWYAMPFIIVLMVLMLLVETISHVIRPVSLTIRLGANMFADHAVVGAFYRLLAWVVPIPVMTLGILVCVVQTLVFCLLSTIYISMAIQHEEH